MDLKLNADRFTGYEYVNIYDKYRPSPPIEILHQALNYLGKSKAERILDLGCGTGISTRIWKDYAKEIIGIEPSIEMIEVAKNKSKNNQIKYLTGYSNNIQIESNSVDIVSCSQSFHWMEPKSTLKEVCRVLRNRGILVIYDAILERTVKVNHLKRMKVSIVN